MNRADIIASAKFNKNTRGNQVYFDTTLPEPVGGISTISIPATNEDDARTKLTTHFATYRDEVSAVSKG